MKKLLLLLTLTSIFSCNFSEENSTNQYSERPSAENAEAAKDSINRVLENWHSAAAQADFDEYFRLMTEDGIFLGTDATENWQNEEFREFAKPLFDAGKAWNFTTLERNVYTGENGETAWFDELLDTQMGICRGSGVMVKTEEGWRIKHYVLSITIPNENTSEVTALKKEFDTSFISRLE